jgi:hypothetical protein
MHNDLIFLQWLITECGYRDPKPIGDGRWYACIIPKMYTHAIATGEIGDEVGIHDTWCYHSYADAKFALDAWDGRGEPTGWHRHPPSGRRVSESPDEVDQHGNEVGSVGVTYRRF